MGWLAVYQREMVLMQKKIGKLGYVFSTLLFPLIYLFAFGWGIGGNIAVEGGYVPFLAKGMVTITVMLNAFQQTALSVSMGRFYFGSFQTLMLSPISLKQIALGIVLGGMTRGILAGGCIYLIAMLIFDVPMLQMPGIVGVVLTAICFASVGIAVGMWVKNPDSLSLVINFLITPMTFFCGSFFPLNNLPAAVKGLVQILPLSLANELLRMSVWTMEAVSAMVLLLLMAVLMFFLGVYQLNQYTE